MIIPLHQYHFKNGTVIIHNDYYIACDPRGDTKMYPIERSEMNVNSNSKSTNNNNVVFQLQENIEFNPNAMETTQSNFLDSGVPWDEQLKSNGGYYPDMEYGLGFFAAISIAASNIELDLNGYTLAQSSEHYIRQRFFSLIEMADAPFIPNVGPHDFTTHISCAHYCEIHNGKLGLSSHHGIHGNNCSHNHIHNLEIEEFEVAAIALNGSKYNLVENVNIHGNKQDIPILGIWSTGTFLYPYLKELVNKTPHFELKTSYNTVTAYELFYKFRKTYQSVADKMIGLGRHDEALFRNDERVTTSTVYGIVFHDTGVAVNGFPTKVSETNYDNRILHCKIHNLITKNVETPTLTSGLQLSEKESKNIYNQAKVQSDVVGSIVQTQNGDLTINEKGVYIGNIISDAQLIIAKAIHEGITFKRSVSKNKIDKDMLNWVESGSSIQDTNMLYVFQGDIMHHVLKGIIGIKIDSIKHAHLEQIELQHFHNKDKSESLQVDDLRGIDVSTLTPEQSKYYNDYKNGKTKSHSLATYYQNQKSFVRGISMSSASDVTIKQVSFLNLVSDTGNVIEIDRHENM